MSRFATLLIVGAVAASACATGTAGRPVPQPFPRPAGGTDRLPGREPTVASAPSQEGYAITGTALSFRGVPYRNGGGDPSGFDCSGFVWYVFAQHQIELPRTVSDQFQTGRRVDNGPLDAGDLLFFNTTGAGPTHVGIAIGGDEFVHAPSSTGEVRVERLGSSYWSARFVGARRVL